ncbi:MAG: hypothetical protein Q8O23_01380, partial [Gallionella sp.]|nr:hypothetical protein [Gallionella sp.]
TLSGTGTINNAGEFRKSLNVTPIATSISTVFNNQATGVVNVNSSTLDINGTLTQAGTINVASGTTFQKTGGFSNAAGGIISGIGTIDVGAGNTLINAGTIRPGGLGTAGTLNVSGNLVLTGGTLDIDIGGLTAGTQHDSINVTGNTTLGGTLNVTETGGFTTKFTDSLTVIAGTVAPTNAFSLINSTATGGTAAFGAAISGNNVNLALASGTTTWNTDSSGNWATAANWTRGTPTANANAVIDRAGGSPIVTLASGSYLINSLSVGAGDSLYMEPAAVATIAGALTNTGTIRLRMANGASTNTVLTVNNSFTNNGVIELGTNFSGATVSLTVNAGAGTLTNASGATLRTGFTGSTEAGSIINANVTNQGTMDVTAGLSINNPATFDSSGISALTLSNGAVLTVNGGTTQLGAGTVLSGTGTLSLAGTHTLALPSSFTNPTGTAQLALSGAVTVNGPGTLTNQGTLQLSNDTINAALDNQSGGMLFLEPAAVATIAGALNNTGTIRLRMANGAPANTVLTVNNSFTNNGVIELGTNFSGAPVSLTVNGGAGTLTNASGATLRTGFTGSTEAGSIINANVTNQGTMDVTAGVSISSLASNNGTINLSTSNPTLTLSSGALSNTGIIQGGGTINLAAATLTNNGTISPGVGAGNTATLGITGNLAQGAGGQINMDINGAGAYDVLAVTGTVNLAATGSTLNIAGSQPAGSYTVITGSSVSGTFSTINSMFAASPTYNAANLTLGLAAGVFWDGGASTLNWADLLNWSGDVLPSISDLVLVSISGGGTVSLSSGTHSIKGLTTVANSHLSISGGSLTLSDAGTTSTLAGNLTMTGGVLSNIGTLNLAALNLSGGTLGGSGALTVTGPFNITGNSTLAGTGQITTQGTTTINMGVANGILGLTGGKTWVNEGTLTVGGDDSLYFGYSSGGANTLTNAAGGTLNLSSSNATPLRFWGGTATLNNAGILNQTATGTHNIHSGIAFNNTGTVNVDAGTLSIGGGGSDTGLYAVDAATTIEFFGGTRNLDTGVAFSGAGILQISGGTVNVNNPLTIVAPTINLSGGTLGGAGALTTTGAFNVTGTSTLTGAGLLTTQGTTTINMGVANGILGLTGGKTWVNEGTLTVGGDDSLYFGYSSGGANTLTNAAGGTLNLSSSNATPLRFSGGTATLNNAGILNQTATGTHNIHSGIAFNNTGTVN